MPVFFVSGFLLFLLTACQSISAPEPYAEIKLPPVTRHYRLFIEGQLRLGDGDNLGAANLFAAVAAAEPGNSSLVLAQAEALLRAEDDEAALRAVEAALQLSPRNPDLLFFLGNFHFNRGEILKAIEYFQRGYDTDPSQESGAFSLVIALIKNGDIDRAAVLLKKMVEEEPEYTVAELMLARIYREKGDFLAAEDILHRIEEREPELDAPRLELAALFESREEWLRAIAYYRTALDLNPENITIRHHLAQLYIKQNDLSLALTEFKEILLLNPSDLDARRKVGLIYLERKEFSEAIQVFKALIESAPELDEVRFYLGTAYERRGEDLTALTYFETVSEKSGIYNDALMHRVFILRKLQRLGEAIELLENQLARSDVFPEMYLYLSSLYEMRGMKDLVLETLRRTRERFSDNAEVAYRLGLLYDRHQQTEAAIAEIRRAINLDANHAEALNYLAYYYAERHECLDEALEMAQRALLLKEAAHIFDTLGWVYYVRGDFDSARKYLAEAIKKSADDPIILEHYGDALLAKKAYKEAMVIYQRSLDVQPENESLRAKLKALLPVRER